MKVYNLRVEYLENPLGIDEIKPRFSWKIRVDHTKRNVIQTHYQIQVASNLDLLNSATPDMWNTKEIESSQSVNVEYLGKTLQPFTKYYWKLIITTNHSQKDEEIAEFSMGLINQENWEGEWIGMKSTPKNNVKIPDHSKINDLDSLDLNPAIYLRKEFSLNAIESATLYATAMGTYVPFINGERVGDSYFSPEWTDYSKRVLYQTYDVTENLQLGDNVVGAILADGWYCGFLGPGDKIRQNYYGEERRFNCFIRIQLTNGSTKIIKSDNSWLLTDSGPIRKADHFMGEVYDARKGFDEWCSGPLNKREINGLFNEVSIDNSIKVPIQAQYHEPVQVYAHLTPIEIFPQKEEGSYVFDMGQNMVGIVSLTHNTKGKGYVEGDEIVIRHGEMKNDDDSLYDENLRIATQTDRFILSTSQIDSSIKYSPLFTFHGFRFVEVSGLKHIPKLEDPDFLIIGLAMASNPPLTGKINTSNALINQLTHNILWTQRDNMLSIPTDCPQRNERLGWMGDIYGFAQTSMYNMHMGAFLTKFCQDIRDAQTPEGKFPHFAPRPFEGEEMSDSPGWSDAGILLPWLMYVNYNDERILEVMYGAIKKNLDHIKDRNPTYLWEKYAGNFNDWLNGNTIKSKGYPKRGGALPKPMFATIMYAHSVEIFSKMCMVLGKSKVAKEYQKFAQDIKDAFLTRHLKKNFITNLKGQTKPNNYKLKGGTQSAYALSLNYDMLPEEYEDRALNLMIENLQNKYDGRMSTGFLSTTPMMLELSAREHHDLACSLALSKRLPSWGYSIEQGATTIWERWDGYVKGRGFASKGMNSFNHYCFGAVGEWIYKTLMGIRPDESRPGYSHFIVHPQIDKRFKFFEGEYDSIHGEIIVKWKYNEEGWIDLLVQVPANTTATLILDIENPDCILNTKDQDGITHISGKLTPQQFTLDSGTYEFMFD